MKKAVLKELWRNLDPPLKVMSLMVTVLSLLLIWMLTIITKGLFILVILAFWGIIKLLNRWSESP
jgi:hypothetical protein